MKAFTDKDLVGFMAIFLFILASGQLLIANLN